MPSEKNLKSIFSDIATQIREKLKTTDLIKPYNMADKIKEISSGVDFQTLESYPTDFSLLHSKKCYTGFDKGKEFYIVFEGYLIPLDSFFIFLTGTTVPTPIFKVDTENDIPTATMGFYYTNAFDNMYIVMNGEKQVLAPISTTLQNNTVFAVDANVNRWILRYETYFGEKFKNFEFYAPGNGPSVRMTSLLSLEMCSSLGINNKIYPIVISFESISQDELSDKKYPNDVIYMYVNFNNQNGKVFLKTNNTVSIAMDDLPDSMFVDEAMYKYTEEDVTTSINNGEQFFAVIDINEADSAYGWNTYQYKDKNIIPENIKFGVNINGVTGTLPSPQGKIEIRNTEETNVARYETAQVVDSNLVPENIAKDVTILGVTGTLSTPKGKKEITNTEEVDVSNYATAQVVDVNLVPENIAKGKTILGVTGIGEPNISENIKIVSSSSDILSSETNKLCILSESNNLSYKIVSNVDYSEKYSIAYLPDSRGVPLVGTCSASYKNNLYVFGGNNGGFSDTIYNTIYKINHITLEKTKLNVTLPMTLTNAVCEIYNDNIYILGGSNADFFNKTVYKFNCITETIETLSVKTQDLEDGACCSIYGENIYIFDERYSGSSKIENLIYKFNCISETIETLNVTIPKEFNVRSSITYNNIIYLFSRVYQDSVYSEHIHKFNPMTKTIEEISITLPSQTIFRSSSKALYKDSIYIFGGYDLNGRTYLNTIYKFNCKNESISKLGSTLPSKLSNTYCFIHENKIYISGGYDGKSYSNKVYRFWIYFTLTSNNILIYSANSDYSFDLTTNISIPIKNIYIGNASNRAEFAKAYLYNEKQSAWVNINTGEKLTA